MKVAVLGGTGKFGGGLAARLAEAGHEVVVGSRKAEKAQGAAEKYADKSDAEVDGASNADAAAGTDVAVLGVPPQHAAETARSVLDGYEGVVVTPVVGMSREEGDFVYTPPEEGSSAEEIRGALDDEVPLAGAFHNLAAGKLADLSVEIEADVAVFGDDEAKETTSQLVEDVGARPLDVGGFGVAEQVESLTPLLVNVGTKNGIKDAGVRFV
ncbi:MAG: NADPH-dependent F420 reductase [Halobacteriales archaeon]|nr:NADPH-dependent F420 reductase [Halobacteriales archaeon]